MFANRSLLQCLADKKPLRNHQSCAFFAVILLALTLIINSLRWEVCPTWQEKLAAW